MKSIRTGNEEVEGGAKMHFLQGARQERRIKASVYPGGLAGWLLRCLRRADANGQAAKQMRLLETLPLGGKRNLMLVSCAGELFLVGGSFEGIESIVRVHGETPRGVAAVKKMDGLCL